MRKLWLVALCVTALTSACDDDDKKPSLCDGSQCGVDAGAVDGPITVDAGGQDAMSAVDTIAVDGGGGDVVAPVDVGADVLPVVDSVGADSPVVVDVSAEPDVTKFDVPVTQVVAPTISPPAGTYFVGQNVELSDSEAGVVIHYTLDGTVPTPASTVYQTAIVLPSPGAVTVKAIAVKAGVASPVTEAIFVINALPTTQVAAPTFAPPGGAFTTDVEVALTTTTPGAVIRYTTDGSVPTETSDIYSAPIAVRGPNAAVTIRAIATQAGLTNSTLSSATYTVAFPRVAPPVLTPAGGSFAAQQTITITAVDGAVIHYTTNGTDPTEDSRTYTGPIVMEGSSLTVKAIAVKEGLLPSFVAEGVYRVVTAATRVLVVSPHPDDDIITAAGVIRRAVQNGNQVRIVYVTNGDKMGVDVGLSRQAEAVHAEGLLGVPESDLVFFGYPDGHTDDIAASATKPEDVFTAANGQTHTYGARGLGGKDYHSYLHGSAASYNWPNMVADMVALLSDYMPTDIFTTGQMDAHGDHATAFVLTSAAIQALLQTRPTYQPTVHKTIVWSNATNDLGWPAPAAPDQYFTEIPNATTLGLVWSGRESLDVPLSMQSTTLTANLKWRAIAQHASQNQGMLTPFVHKDEIFWPERPATPTDLPPIVNAGVDQTVAVGASVTLNGSASVDPEGTPLTYAWSQASGPTVVLSSPASAQPTFVAPACVVFPEQLSFQLSVADGLGRSMPDAVTVTVRPASVPQNLALTSTATASSQVDPDQTAAKVIDGVLQGYPEGTGEWSSNGEGVGAWVRLTWTTPQVLNQVVLYDRPNLTDQVLGGTLTFSDGEPVPVGALGNDGTPVPISFLPRTVTWVQFTVESVSESTSNVGLEELEAWNLTACP